MVIRLQIAYSMSNIHSETLHKTAFYHPAKEIEPNVNTAADCVLGRGGVLPVPLAVQHVHAHLPHDGLPGLHRAPIRQIHTDAGR